MPPVGTKAKTPLRAVTCGDRRSIRAGPNLRVHAPNLRRGWGSSLSFYSNGLNRCGPNLGVPNGGPSLFVYPPFLLAGLLRWRIVDAWAFIPDCDPTGAMMLNEIEKILPAFEMRALTETNLERLVCVLREVQEELKGTGTNPDLLLDIAALGT